MQMTTVDEHGCIESDIDSIILGRSTSLPSEWCQPHRTGHASVPDNVPSNRHQLRPCTSLTASLRSLSSGTRRSAFNVYRQPFRQGQRHDLEPLLIPASALTTPLSASHSFEVWTNERARFDTGDLYSPDSGIDDPEHVYETIDDDFISAVSPIRRNLIPPPLPVRNQSPAYVSPIRLRRPHIKTNPRGSTLRYDSVRSDKHASTSTLPHYAAACRLYPDVCSLPPDVCSLPPAPRHSVSMHDVSRCRETAFPLAELSQRRQQPVVLGRCELKVVRRIEASFEGQLRPSTRSTRTGRYEAYDFESQFVPRPWRPLHSTLC